ncbi:unnamed protein product, partial [Prorocentrum cordatum]
AKPASPAKLIKVSHRLSAATQHILHGGAGGGGGGGTADALGAPAAATDPAVPGVEGPPAAGRAEGAQPAPLPRAAPRAGAAQAPRGRRPALKRPPSAEAAADGGPAADPR